MLPLIDVGDSIEKNFRVEPYIESIFKSDAFAFLIIPVFSNNNDNSLNTFFPWAKVGDMYALNVFYECQREPEKLE